MMTVWMYEDVKVAFSPPAGTIMVMSAVAIRNEPEHSEGGGTRVEISSRDGGGAAV